jgi:hypothetical protein
MREKIAEIIRQTGSNQNEYTKANAILALLAKEGYGKMLVVGARIPLTGEYILGDPIKGDTIVNFEPIK